MPRSTFYEISLGFLIMRRHYRFPIDNDVHAIDLDIRAEVSEKLGVVLDKYDPIKEEYSLEVCSPLVQSEIKDYAI